MASEIKVGEIKHTDGSSAMTIDSSGNARLHGSLRIGNVVNAGVPSGCVSSFAMASAPTGWIVCDGSAISRTTYSVLFSAISTTWGAGNGSTTFNIPDLRGSFLRGTGSHGTQQMADTNPYAGPAVGAFEADDEGGHTHTGPSHTHAYNHQHSIPFGHTSNPSNSRLGSSNHNAANFWINNFSGNTGSGGTGASGSTGGDESRPFNAGIQWCIKY